MASLHTPRQRGLPRYSTNSTAGTSPNNNFGASTSAMRQSTLRALNGQTDPRTPAAKGAEGDLEVGDLVNVPGDMFGTVKFVGTVRGKNGTFVGVELHEPFASRGKNDGDVDGVPYFTTTIPGAGIFLPIQRASKRLASPTTASSSDSYPGTPNTPSYSTARTGSRGNDGTTTTPALPSKLAQSVGPGVRPSSPNFKPKRPSLPRPESPLRKQPPTLAPTPGRNLSQSVMGSKTPAKSASHTNFKASTTAGRPSVGVNNRPYSRSSSRMGNGGGVEEENKVVGRTTSSGSIPSFSQPLRSPSRLGSAGGSADEVQRLKRELAERDKRLDEQATNLAEMEQSVKELSAILPVDSPSAGVGGTNGLNEEEDHKTVAQFRQLLREKNDKISLLTAEFDAHRADFRSTLDSLEMASTETERVYEEQKRDLLAQLQEVRQNGEDFDGVARQLKQLEEFVAELEEGLEESRRGEAEARGEVEFLRGEVERGRSELRREREKAARGSAEGGGGMVKEMERKDDEIRGLKAIIHGLSSTGSADGASVNGDGADAEEMKRLKDELDASRKEKEGLEEELEVLRRRSANTNSSTATATPTTNGASHSRTESQRTATVAEGAPSTRPRGDTIRPTPLFASSSSSPTKAAAGPNGLTNGSGAVYCEMCESSEHDTLECSRLSSTSTTSNSEAGAEADSPGKENRENGVGKKGQAGNGDAGEGDGAEDKWCALCERDGHLAFDCPEEVY